MSSVGKCYFLVFQLLLFHSPTVRDKFHTGKSTVVIHCGYCARMYSCTHARTHAYTHEHTLQIYGCCLVWTAVSSSCCLVWTAVSSSCCLVWTAVSSSCCLVWTAVSSSCCSLPEDHFNVDGYLYLTLTVVIVA